RGGGGGAGRGGAGGGGRGGGGEEGQAGAAGLGAWAAMGDRLLTAVLDELARWYRAWLDQPQPGDADGCGLRAEYLRRSGTVGTAVTVMLPGGQNLTGMAAGIDTSG